jgi:hypothetical protein
MLSRQFATTIFPKPMAAGKTTTVPTAYSGSMSSSAAAPTLPPYFASELTEPTRHWRYRLAHGNGLAEIRLEQTGCQRGTGPRPSVPQIEKRPRPKKSRGR